MTPVITGIIGIIIFLLLLATKIPIALAMTMVGLAGFACLVSPAAAFHMTAAEIYNVFSSYSDQVQISV